MLTLLLIAALLLGNLLLTAIIIWRAARWLRAGFPYFSRAFRAACGMLVVGAFSSWLDGALIVGDTPTRLMASGALIIVQIAVSFLIIRSSLRSNLRAAAVIWIVSLISPIMFLLLLYFLVKPFVLEMFVVPTNAMAPTVIGWHRTVGCPHCEQLMTVPAPDPQEPRPLPFELEPLGICTSCRKTAEVQLKNAPVEAPDRIVVNKLLTPRRWDIVAFRYPHRPEIKDVKRLVGLPGETMFIKDGDVWINGVRAEPPMTLAGIEYGHLPFRDERNGSGTAEDPWRLGPDEFFVLGDFAKRSADSRVWGPVPRANLEGVVTLIYWPPSRWRVFR